jgi:aminocarboxymuconate-semialdehyde decarboxylase
MDRSAKERAVTQAIDVHCHFVPSQFPAYRGKNPGARWPSMQHDGCGHANVMIQGKNYRTVVESAWDGAKRIVDMDRMGIARQILSPMPELLSYWLPLEDAKLLLRHTNDEIAALCAAHPQRFSGLGGVPLQDMDAAMRELEHILRAQKLLGVEIATNVNGVPVGDARFEPFFAEAERLGAPIFVHALHPAGKDRLIGPPALEQVVAFPGDVALGIASLITGGVLERHPRLRIGFSHGGGAFAMVLPRLEHGWNVVPAIREAIPQAPSAYARRLYYDCLVYDAKTLAFVIERFGAERIMIGTDYPFNVHDKDPLGSIAALGLDETRAKLLREENARRFLGGSI